MPEAIKILFPYERFFGAFDTTSLHGYQLLKFANE